MLSSSIHRARIYLMKERFCPNCKNVLGEFDHYFCSVCGTKLTKETIAEFGGVRVRTFKLASVTRSPVSDILAVFRSIKTYYIFSLLVFIFFVGYGITRTGLIEFANYEFKKNPQTNVKIPQIINIKTPEVTLDISATSGKFTTTKFAEIIPSTASLYMEGYDIAFFAKYMIRDENLAPLLKKPTLLLEDGYAGFRYEDAWGYILSPKDSEIVLKVMGDVKDPYWKFRIIKDKFVMASDVKVFSAIAEIEKGTKPSLSLNSEFVKRDQTLSPEGRGKIIFMQNEAFDILRNSLGGLDQATISNVNKILTAGFDSIVIK